MTVKKKAIKLKDNTVEAYEKLKKTNYLLLLDRLSVLTSALTAITLSDNIDYQKSMFAIAINTIAQLNEHINKSIQIALM